MSKASSKTIARRALACLDLTNLEDGCSPADIDRLCERAQTRHGPVAAVCIWPRFVTQAKAQLKETPVRIATVVNFPAGDAPPAWIVGETRSAALDGADEIDMVIPWRLVSNDPEEVGNQIARVRKAAKGVVLKAILETGELKKDSLIRKATDIAIRSGADFVKTSTGKVKVNATPEAAKIMLEAISGTGGKTGFKAAGGVRTVEDASVYLGLADRILGKDWAGPATFRFGASGLLDALLAELDGGGAKSGGAISGGAISGGAKSDRAKSDRAKRATQKTKKPKKTGKDY